MCGNIFERKKRLIDELKKIQRILDFRFSPKLQDRENTLRQEIEEILWHEELLWCQKSEGRWFSCEFLSIPIGYFKAICLSFCER